MAHHAPLPEMLFISAKVDMNSYKQYPVYYCHFCNSKFSLNYSVFYRLCLFELLANSAPVTNAPTNEARNWLVREKRKRTSPIHI